MSFSEADYQAAAAKLGVPIAAVKAVADVESNGVTFWADGRPPILFEAQWFHKLTNGAYDATHPGISSPVWDRSLYIGGPAEYGRFDEAAALDRNAALQSISMGAFQIMGFHWKTLGYVDPQSMYSAMATSAGGQLDAFVRFIQANPALEDALRRQDWWAFAAGYNGTGQVEAYAAKIATAYAHHLDSDGDNQTNPHRNIIQLGDKGDDVKALQTALAGLGYALGWIDGQFGPRTEFALKAFQEARGLVPDAVCGPLTRKELGLA